MSTETWPYTLDLLCDEVVRCLDHYGLRDGVADHRVSAAPDGRTIRYYTTLGLLDRPHIEGRQARYGSRHLLQLLAIKALQVHNLSLADIQTRLYGRSEPELLAIVEAVASQHSPPTPEVRPVIWREVTIEPGLKILVEESYTPTLEPALLQARILAALAAMRTQRPDPQKSS